MFLIIVSIALVLIVIASIIGFSIYNNRDENKINSDVLISNQLYNDYENGIITTDEYVRYLLYTQYDTSMLDEKYQNLLKLDDAINIEELINKYYDELSNETLTYFSKKINLNNITFEVEKENEETTEDRLNYFYGSSCDLGCSGDSCQWGSSDGQTIDFDPESIK